MVNTGLERALADENPDLERIESMLDGARKESVALDGSGLGFALGRTMEALMVRLRSDPTDHPTLDKLQAVAVLVNSVPFEVNVWRVQNLYYEMLQQVCPQFRARTDEEAKEWVARFTELGKCLSVRVE